MSDAAAAQRREIYYSGRVQGVGFRYTVASVAKRFAVTGFVRNLRDGRVELVSEGPAGEIRAFFEAVAEQMGHYIDNVWETATPATGQFDGFEIRY